MFPVEESVAAIVGEAVQAFERPGRRWEASIGLKRSQKSCATCGCGGRGRSAAVAAA